MKYITKLRITAWFESYYQPDKLKRNELLDPGFGERYLNGLLRDFKQTGKCAISKFDSTIGLQIEFDNDPNRIL